MVNESLCDPAFGDAPWTIISCTNGRGLSSATSFSASCDSDTGTPSRTSRAAALRFSGVIRLTAPSWSSLPQRPQLDNSDIHLSNSALLTGRGVCAAADIARNSAGNSIGNGVGFTGPV